MKVLFIISTDDAETMYNALRMANVGIQNPSLRFGKETAYLDWRSPG